MKIYKVVYLSVYANTGDSCVIIKTFLNHDNALKYLKREIETLKKEFKDSTEYCIYEDDTSYERHLRGRAIEDCISVYLEDDDTYDEIILQEEKDDYEI